MIAMPRPRLEIAEVLIQHLVEFGEHFDDLVIGIAVIGVDIVAGAMTARTPDNGNFLGAEEIARRLDLRPALSSNATWCICVRLPHTKLMVWWSGPQRMK